MMKIKTNICFVAITIFLTLLGCSIKSKENIVLTRDYIINPSWNEVNNTLIVYRMKLKDSTQTIDLTDPSEAELFNGLVEDSSFLYHTRIRYNGEDFTKRKVYFNKYNGFRWCDSNNMHSDCEKRTLEQLRQETWYVFYGLSSIHTTAYYAYFDSSDSLYLFRVGMMTNY